MTEWKEYKLGEIVTFQRGHDLPKDKMIDGDIPVAGSNGIIGYHNQFTKEGPGVTIGRSGNIGIPHYYPNAYWAHNTVLYIVDFKGNDAKFMYYLLKTFDFTQLNTGSAVPSLNRNHIHELPVSIPDVSTQRRIAAILSSLDDKIDLLHRENATLEAMAETLFRQWFVVEAKEEWEEVLITELFEVKDGTHDSPKPQEYGHKLITSKYIHNNSIDLNGAYNISDTDFTNINKRSKVDTNDILFSMIGTIGLIYLEQNEIIDYAIKNVGLIKTSQNSNWKYFIYLWFKSELGLEWIHENKTGSTQEYISLNSLRSIKFRIKDLKQVQEFDQTVNIYFEKLRTNKQQIRTLIQTRDGLLPRLMSGEVKI